MVNNRGKLLRRIIASRRKWWAALLLPAFLLRALIPVGFMPMVGPDFTVRMMVCRGYAPLPDGPAPAGHGAPAHEDHGNCPYGASPALGALAQLSAQPIVVARLPDAAVPAAQIDFFSVSFRAQSPRGPPA